MAKNEPFNSSNQGAAGSGLRTNRVEGASRMHKPYFKLGVEANNAEPGRFHQTAIETSRNGFPVETTAAVTVCPFGDLVTIPGTPPTQGVRGGLITCGDKNFNVAAYEIDVAADGEKVIYITIPCECNMDDDSELLLSGIKTSSTAAIAAMDWTVAAAYPANTNPTVASAGIGTFIFPVGSVTITDGVAADFVPTGCGTCNITHCAGTLSHTRG